MTEHKSISDAIESLRTGDILLFEEEPKCGSIFRLIDWAIRWWTSSQFSHAGLVVVDPPMGITEKDESGNTIIIFNKEPLKGTYIWDSSKHSNKDPEDGLIKFGIALVPAERYFNNPEMKHQALWKRSPVDEKTYECWNKVLIKKMYKEVYNKPYDINLGHWLAGMFHIIIPKTTETFWCSAFVTYALCYVGILDGKCTNWTLKSPEDLSSSANAPLEWKKGKEYGPNTLVWST